MTTTYQQRQPVQIITKIGSSDWQRGEVALVQSTLVFVNTDDGRYAFRHDDDGIRPDMDRPAQCQQAETMVPFVQCSADATWRLGWYDDDNVLWFRFYCDRHRGDFIGVADKIDHNVPTEAQVRGFA
jgi:hypothetical protein